MSEKTEAEIASDFEDVLRFTINQFIEKTEIPVGRLCGVMETVKVEIMESTWNLGGEE